MAKIRVGKLYQTLTYWGSMDRGVNIPGIVEVVKVIAITDDQITYQKLNGTVSTTLAKYIEPLPKHFEDALYV